MDILFLLFPLVAKQGLCIGAICLLGRLIRVTSSFRIIDWVFCMVNSFPQNLIPLRKMVNRSTCSGAFLVSAYFRSGKRSKITPRKIYGYSGLTQISAVPSHFQCADFWFWFVIGHARLRSRRVCRCIIHANDGKCQWPPLYHFSRWKSTIMSISNYIGMRCHRPSNTYSSGDYMSNELSDLGNIEVAVGISTIHSPASWTTSEFFG